MVKPSFGVIGLGVMGKNLALNILDKGHSLAVFNRPEEAHLINEFLLANESNSHSLQGFTDLHAFIRSLEKPRKLLMMIKAGPTVDLMLDALIPLLSAGDIVIDGGNSHFEDTNQRKKELSKRGIHFIGCGISGGEEGARNGPSLMPGGSKDGYIEVENILQSIAARDRHGDPCCHYIGPGGAGHFIKMIHNGIEYAEMQLLAEVYHLLAIGQTNEDLADQLNTWKEGPLSSFLLDITVDILQKKESDQYLLDLILDKAGNKGTGSWSSQEAMKLGFPATMITDAVFARYISSFKETRIQIGQTRDHQQIAIPNQVIHDAYHFSRLINHIQGFELINQAAQTYDWSLDLSEIARIWTNGCIIRSTLMEEFVGWLRDSASPLTDPGTITQLSANAVYTAQILNQGITHQIPLPVFSSGYQYWLGMTTPRLPANLIQAQRDYFGAHTYQRSDKGKSDHFHTNWKA